MSAILVTGGAKGLGAEICRTLAALGHNVVVHYRTSQKEAHQVVSECSQAATASMIQGDFSTLASLEDFIRRYKEQFPQTKGIVNNVGNYLIAPLFETQALQWLDLFQTNFFAPLLIIQALLPQLRAFNGSIVNIGVSGLLSHRGFTQATAYAATKSTLYFYTRSLAKELVGESIRVNMVSPGYMENTIDFIDASEFPMQRPITLKEVAFVVASLFDPRNISITGQNIEVAGGVGL